MTSKEAYFILEQVLKNNNLVQVDSMWNEKANASWEMLYQQHEDDAVSCSNFVNSGTLNSTGKDIQTFLVSIKLGSTEVVKERSGGEYTKAYALSVYVKPEKTISNESFIALFHSVKKEIKAMLSIPQA